MFGYMYKNRQQQQVHVYNFKYIRPDDIDNIFIYIYIGCFRNRWLNFKSIFCIYCNDKKSCECLSGNASFSHL